MHHARKRQRDRESPREREGAHQSSKQGSALSAIRDASPGSPLSSDAAAALEPRFGHSFDNVMVHDGADAQRLAGELDAEAFAVGTDLFFADGRYDPTSPSGMHLLAHELSHVVQHDAAREPDRLRARDFRVSVPNEPSERAAEHAAERVLADEGPNSVGAIDSAPAGEPGVATVHRWPSFDWLEDAASSVMNAGASLFGGGSAPAAPSNAGAGTGGVATAGPGGGVAAGPGGGAPAPAAGPGKDAAPDPKRVAAAVGQLNSAMKGWGTDEDAIYATLRGKSKAEIAAIKAEYEKATGTSLDAALADEMSGAELQEARDYLSGDPAKGVVGSLVNAASGLGTDEAKIMSTLKGMSPDDYLRVKKEFKERTGQSIDEMFQDELSGAELKDARAALAAKFGTGLGGGVDALAKKSPTLMKELNDIADQGWAVSYGEAGKGYYADSNTKSVVVDPKMMGEGTDSANIIMQLSHEVGHAVYTEDPYVKPDGLTKDEFVSKNTMRHLKNEGAATINNLVIRDEILKAKGPDVDVAGMKSEEYKKLYAKYRDPKDREKLLEEIGKVYAKGEVPSGDSGAANYEDYYSDTYKKMYDEYLAAKKAP